MQFPATLSGSISAKFEVLWCDYMHSLEKCYQPSIIVSQNDRPNDCLDRRPVGHHFVWPRTL